MKTKKCNIIEQEDDSTIKEIIGKRIKRARSRHGQSAQTIAEKVGISRSSLTQIETGRNNISATLLWKIAGVLHCEIKEFFPDVPDSTSLEKSDLDIIAKENSKAAEFMKKAFKMK